MLLKKIQRLSKEEAKMETPLRLAYIGDAVFESMVRFLILKRSQKTVHHLHREAIGFVSAQNQSNILKMLTSSLTEEELDIVRRGRNAKSATVPKNADIMDYKNATALETLFGYHYIQGNEDRVSELFQMAVCILEEVEKDEMF